MGLFHLARSFKQVATQLDRKHKSGLEHQGCRRKIDLGSQLRASPLERPPYQGATEGRVEDLLRPEETAVKADSLPARALLGHVHIPATSCRL